MGREGNKMIEMVGMTDVGLVYCYYTNNELRKIKDRIDIEYVYSQFGVDVVCFTVRYPVNYDNSLLCRKKRRKFIKEKLLKQKARLPRYKVWLDKRTYVNRW